MARKNGDGGFRPLSNGTIEFQVSTGVDIYGKRQRKAFYGKTEAECRRKYKQFLKEGEPKSKSKEPTLADWLDTWLTTYKKSKVSEGTYDDYTGLAAHVKKHKLGSLKLSDVKPIHVTEFFGTKSEYSYSFLKRMRFLLNGAFESALDNEICLKNPVRNAEIPDKVQPEREAFTEEEVRIILDFAKTDDLFGVAIYIMLHTGIRSGEMRALTLCDINFSDGIITIDKAVKRNGELGLPKNNKTRYIPLKPEVVDFLRSNPKCGPYIVGNAYYVSKEGFRSRYDCFFDRLNKHLLRTGQELIEVKSPHSLRHTFGTICQINGMPIAMVSELMGHHSTEVTDRYTHVNDTNVLTKAVWDYGLPT
ncbi:MAG: site-specific integrase [Oscillospiraceae bacterium]|nr:site-specific integrase [Oscillospiraceae bacterium]